MAPHRRTLSSLANGPASPDPQQSRHHVRIWCLALGRRRVAAGAIKARLSTN